MTFLNVTIAVLLFVALLVLLLLVSPLWLRIKYAEGITVYAGVGPVRTKLYPSKEKNKKKSEQKKKKKKKKKKSAKPPAQPSAADTQKKQTTKSVSHKEADDEISAKEVLDFVLDILERVVDLFHKKAKIKIDALRVVVSKPDAADTAIQFGLCSGLVSSILAFTSNFGKSMIKDKNVSIVPDFITGKSRVETDVTLSVKACHAATMLLKMFYEKTLKN